MAGPLIVADSLACRRAGREVFRGVGFTLKAGDALMLRGPNGSGKSSLLRILAGLLPPAGGEFSVSAPLHYLGHQDPVKPGLTVEENLRFAVEVLGGGAIAAGLEGFGLKGLADSPARRLSAGQKRRLGLARLLAVSRPLWLLDEPATGLDARNRARLDAAIAAHREAGGGVIAASHGDIAIPDAALFELGA